MAGYAEVAKLYAQNAAKLRQNWQTIDINAWLAPVRGHLRGHRVLDVGAGTGRLAQSLSKRARVTAVEPVADLWAADLPRVEDTLPRLAKTSGRYDLTLCLGVLHHLTPRDQRGALHRMARLTRLGGHVIIAARHGAMNAAWPIDAGQLTAPGLTRLSLTRRPALQPANQARGIRFTWVVFRKTA